MTYGLDLTDVRYETDHAGNKLKATIPYSMFSALTEFWKEARRAQTAAIEATARPGQLRGSLQAVVSSEPPAQNDTPAARPSIHPRRSKAQRHDATWEKLLEAIPAETVPAAPEPSPVITMNFDSAAEAWAAQPKRGRPSMGKTKQVIFVREFKAAIPDEVAALVREGVYFLRAWRQYRKLTVKDVAELIGKHKDTVNWHENGYSRPNVQTLKLFADIYDCHIDQLTAKPKSNTQPWLTVISRQTEKAQRKQSASRSPADTDYPDVVLGHLLAGKTPLTAWRLHRGLTIKQLADAYGTTSSNMKAIEGSPALRSRTIGKLCPILKCAPEQLLRPEGMPEPGEMQPASLQDRQYH